MGKRPLREAFGGWRARSLSGLAGALLLGTAGCQTFETSPLGAEAAERDFAVRTLDDPAILKALAAAHLARPDPSAPWTAAELVVVAEAMHPSIARARAELAARQAMVDVAGALPPVGVNFDLQRATSATSPWTYGFTLDGLIELGAKRARRADLARAELNQAALALARTTWETDLTVYRALAGWQQASERERAQAPLAASLGTWRELAQVREDLGEGTRLEFLAVDRERHQLALDQSATTQAREVAGAVLAKALGLPSRALDGLVLAERPADPPAVPDREALWDRAAQSHPDILAALADYAGREAGLRLALAGQYPDLRLGPGFSYDQGQHKWILGFGFTFPIDGNRPAIAQARAELEVSAAAFREAQATVLGTLDEALTRYRGACAQLAQAGALAATSTEAIESQRRLLQLGEGDRLSLVLAQVQGQRDALAQAEARAAAWDAFHSLQEALGAPLEPFSPVSR